MIRMAIIENGKCINIIKTVEPPSLPGKEVVETVEGFGIGDFYTDGVWSKDPIAEAKKVEEAAKRLIEAENIANLSNDAILQFIKNNTLSEIETYIENQYSELINMSDAEIDTYINDNVVNIASTKTALKILAKDLAQTMSILKIVIKISIFLIKKEIS